MKLVNKTVLALGAFVLIAMLGPSLCMGSSDGQQLVSEGDKLLSDFKLSEADKEYREAYGFFQGRGDKAGMALVLEKIADLASNLGDYAVAVQYYAQARTLYSILNQKDAGLRVLTATGMAYEDWGDMPAAIHYYTEALQLAFSSADRAGIESRLGAAYALLGDEDESLSHLKAGKSAAQTAADGVQMGAISMQIADIYRKTGSPDQAGATYQEILGMKVPAAVTIRAQIGLGDLLIASGNVSKAELCYRKANYSVGLGRVALMNGKFDDASKNFQHALAEGERLNDFELVFAARAGLGLVSAAQDQNSSAEEHLRRAVEALEEARDLLPVGKKLYFLSGTTHGFTRLAAYEALVAVLAAEGKSAEAFKFAEYTRSRVLTETLSKTALPQEKGQSMSSQSTAPTASSTDTSPDASYGSVEIVPFSFLNPYFSGARGDSLEAALFSLLIKMVYLDFEKTEAEQALSMGTDLFQKAGFDTRARETLVSKLRELRQKGLQNHLTSLAETALAK
jgi:tetratricopeptide (TPR) repeat protein